ncbi:MAG: DnaA/Hda family protein [Pseudomonadota bacterium]
MMSGNHDTHQFSLDFQNQPVSFAQLVVTGINQVAISAIRAPDRWPGGVFCLVGPPKCGLTTAAHAWAGEFSGQVLSEAQVNAFSPQDIEPIAAEHIAIDRADLIENETVLLTLLNLVPRRGGVVLFTSRKNPALWEVQSADLKSRLVAMPTARIAPPDEEMIKAHLEETGRQKHIKLEPHVVSYLATRLETSYWALDRFMRRLDQHISDTGRGATIPEVKKVLLDLAEEDEAGASETG